VETADAPSGGVAVRDSKNIGPVLVFPRNKWQSFVDGVKLGEFDRLAS
jgi:hypothetical protein